jgi:hypothetical protein
MSNRRREQVCLFTISLLAVMYLPFSFMYASKQTKHVSFPFMCQTQNTHRQRYEHT